jgi:predicted glycosyltransferase
LESPKRLVEKMKAIILSQHNYGVGHFVRSKRFAQLLRQCGYEVVIANGGVNVGAYGEPLPGIEIFALSPLLKRCLSDRVQVGLDKRVNLESLHSERRKEFFQLVAENRPDILITEFYPFSPERLSHTVGDLLSWLASNLPGCRVYSLVRDLPFSDCKTGESPLPKQTDQILRESYDGLLWAGSSSLLANPLLVPMRDHPCPLIPIGFISPAAGAGSATAQTFEVVVSCGAGEDGKQVITKLKRTNWFRSLPSEYRVGVFPGIYADRIESTWESERWKILLGYGPEEIAQHMRRARLVICTAGYNSLVEAACSGAACLTFFRVSSFEQAERARAFAAAGYCRALPMDASICFIDVALASPPTPPLSFNTHTASAQILSRLKV